jgi:hypothetical protein
MFGFAASSTEQIASFERFACFDNGSAFWKGGLRLSLGRLQKEF